METHGFLEGIVCVYGLGIPIPNAQIAVYPKESDAACLRMHADAHGNIKKTSLSCPARTDRPAYTYYDVFATAQGFQCTKERIPIFDGVTTYTSLSLKKEEKPL